MPLIHPKETRIVRTTGDWYPNIDGDSVQCMFYEYPPPVLPNKPTREDVEYCKAHKGQKSWRVSVVGGDDTSVEKWFWNEPDARATFEALTSLCPNHTTLVWVWGFQYQ